MSSTENADLYGIGLVWAAIAIVSAFMIPRTSGMLYEFTAFLGPTATLIGFGLILFGVLLDEPDEESY